MAEGTNTDLLPGLFAPSKLPWETIVDSIREGVLCLEDSRIIYINRAMEEVFDVHRNDVIGNPITFFDDLRELCEEGTKGNPAQPLIRELAFKSSGGETVPITATVTAAVHRDLRMQIVVIRDLSQIKHMEEALLQSRKVQAVGALAGGIAHDFNNILTALLSQLDLAQDATDLSVATREHITQAQTSGRRAAELISRLQTFSRQTQTHTTTIDLAQLIEQVVLILRRSVDRRIDIKTAKLEPGKWLVKGDASQVIQVVFNLCLNARDAMPEGGEIRITVNRSNREPANSARSGTSNRNWLQITVSDNGQGMSPEVQKRVFEPYFTTKTLGRGTGLGLSIAQTIIHDQGGWIEAESQLGEGSSFHVFLPETRATDDSAASRLHEFTSTETRALEGKETILIVDDEEMVRLVMKAVLSYRGYKVIEATDGENMLEVIESHTGPLDLVLLDLDMPKINGWEALPKLKALRPDVRAILLSGGVVESDMGKAKDRGADGFLAKPFKNEKLVQLVRTTLDERKSG